MMIKDLKAKMFPKTICSDKRNLTDITIINVTHQSHKSTIEEVETEII